MMSKSQKKSKAWPRRFMAVMVLFFAAGCSTVASIVYPLNENAERARQGSYVLDDDHASVLFSINHFGFSEFRGRFDTLSGALDLDAETPENSTVTIEVATASLHTGVPDLDEQLFAADMFDTERHPTAAFTSGSVRRTSQGSATIEGVLTIKGISQAFSLEATFIGSGTNPLSGRRTVGFSAVGTLKRSDYGLDNWLPFVGDDVTLEIDVEFAEKR